MAIKDGEVEGKDPLGDSSGQILSPPTRLFLHRGGNDFGWVDFSPVDFSDFSHDLTFAIVSALEDHGIHPPALAIKEAVDNLIHALPCEVSVVVYPELGFVSFSDTGPGIPDISLAMQPGYTTAGSVERKYIRGAGLGFHILTSDLEGAGGRFLIDSRPGTGTYVRLEILPERLRNKAAPCQQRLTVRQVSILTHIAESGPSTVPAIASKIGVSVSTAYRDVRDLVTGGLIIRDSSGKLFLSFQGRRYLKYLSEL